LPRSFGALSNENSPISGGQWKERHCH
jgi:hypothetical protein